MLMAAAALIRDAQRTNFRIDGAAVGGPLFTRFPGSRLAVQPVVIENLNNQTLEAVVSSYELAWRMQSHAPDVFDPALSFRAAKERATARWERWYVTELVRRCGGNLSRAAREARMDRTHLRELVRRYNAPVRDE